MGFTFLTEKQVTRTDKDGEKLQKIYPTDYNLLIAQDLWQAQHQILSIISLKEFMKLNVHTDTMIKNVRLAELNINIVTDFLKTQSLKIV